MKKHWKTLASVSLAVASVSFAGTAVHAADDVAVAEKTDQKAMAKTPTLPDGITNKGLEGEGNDVREALEEITEAAVAKSDMSGVVNRLVKPDRERIGDIKDTKFDDLHAATAKFQAAWKEKYGHEFDIENKEKTAVFGSAIAQGEVNDPAKLMNHWPVPAMAAADNKTQDNAREAGDKGENAEHANLEKGQNVAVLSLPESHGMKALNISLIQESAWHVDVPNTLTGKQLEQNLVKQLNGLTDHKADWPADATQAKAAVAHHVLMALCGNDMSHMDHANHGGK